MVEWDGLENRCTRKRTVGSNPTLSAKYFAPFHMLAGDHTFYWFEALVSLCAYMLTTVPGRG